MKFILGTKIAMTQVFKEDGTVVPVTRIKAGPCVVTQVKDIAKDGVQSVQIGFGEKKLYKVSKPLQGHLKGIGNDTTTVRYLRDFKTAQEDLKKGDTFTVTNFTTGEKIQVTGTSKGKGFQGVVKRHHFHGNKKTHGGKDQERMPGLQRVFKGMRMGGHMGSDRVTVKNLEIIEIHPEINELYIKGAVPGARGSFLLISTNEGKIEVEKMPEVKVNEEPMVVAEVKNEEQVAQ
jgi:large subunit ribosomal protein L3